MVSNKGYKTYVIVMFENVSISPLTIIFLTRKIHYSICGKLFQTYERKGKN